MKRITEYLRDRKWLLLTILAYILIRLPFLDQAFLLRGERDIVLSGWSLLKTGKDFYGNLLPLAFFGLDQPSPFFSFYYSALGWLAFPFKSVFIARLPFMLASAVTTLFIYEIVHFMFKNKKLALLTAGVFGFAPGYFHLSNLALEINIAMPFLLAGILLYLKQQKIFAWACLGISFFAYNGFRPLIPFLLIYLEAYEWLLTGKTKKFLKQSVIAGVLFIIFFATTYFFVDGKIMTSRSSDLVFLSYEAITPQVDFRRNTTVAPLVLSEVLNNKITNTLYYMLEVFQEGISLQYLFFKGDSAAIYATTFSGQFFRVGVLFYFMGFIAMGRRMNKRDLYMLGFIPVALIPSIINIDYVSVAIRSLLASVSYAYIIALGMVFAHDLLKKVRISYRTLAYSVVALLLAIEVVYFGYNYIFRRPVMMFESYFEHERQAANYLIEAEKRGEFVTMYDDSPKNILTAYHILQPDADIRELQRAVTASHDLIESDTFRIVKCPKSGDKDQMYQDGTLIGFACLDPDEYQAILARTELKTIPFKDFSRNQAYFIYQSPVENPDGTPELSF